MIKLGKISKETKGVKVVIVGESISQFQYPV